MSENSKDIQLLYLEPKELDRWGRLDAEIRCALLEQEKANLNLKINQLEYELEEAKRRFEFKAKEDKYKHIILEQQKVVNSLKQEYKLLNSEIIEKYDLQNEEFTIDPSLGIIRII